MRIANSSALRSSAKCGSLTASYRRDTTRERRDGLMQVGGIQDCASAQNCVKACSKGIAVAESIAETNRATWKRALLRWRLR